MFHLEFKLPTHNSLASDAPNSMDYCQNFLCAYCENDPVTLVMINY